MNDIASLLLRAVTAGFFYTHGVPKMLHGEEHAKHFEGMGFVPGARYATLAGTVETTAATLILLGLFGAAGPMMLFSDMIVAIGATSAKENFKITDHEIETVYATIALFLALNGWGRSSFDAAMSKPLFSSSAWRMLSVPGGIAGAVYMLKSRRSAQTKSRSETGSLGETAAMPDAVAQT